VLHLLRELRVLGELRRRRDAEGQLRGSERELLKSYERNRDLSTRLLQAQETERARIAGELHRPNAKLTLKLEEPGGRISSLPLNVDAREAGGQLHHAGQVEVISSLPYYQQYFTDAQRGSGVFGKSIEAMRRLNAVGYGVEGSGLLLNLVYNPVGPYLPPAQAALEADYKRELKARFGVLFNGLFTITNMPINRFRLHLQKTGQLEPYMDKLLAAFNPAAAETVMCRSLISVGHDGRIYDCDFNQMLDMQAGELSIFDFDFERTLKRRIRFGEHCLGCTAGAGSSCGGATT